MLDLGPAYRGGAEYKIGQPFRNDGAAMTRQLRRAGRLRAARHDFSAGSDAEICETK
jgi:hypothetical protein